MINLRCCSLLLIFGSIQDSPQDTKTTSSLFKPRKLNNSVPCESNNRLDKSESLLD